MPYAFLVTTNLDRLMEVAQGRQIVMVDGTVPGFVSREGDLHFDHHKEGGADVQIHEIGQDARILVKNDAVFCTTQVDADACVATAYLIESLINEELYSKLEVISYDCDHLVVPERLSHLSGFAAKVVAAMKSNSESLIEKMGIPKDRKLWDEQIKIQYASAAYGQGVMQLVNALRGEESFPGENGEADKYFEQLDKDIKDWVSNGRIFEYRGCLIFDQTYLVGKYLDPRVPLRASQILGLKPQYPFTITQRKVVNNDEFIGYSYTIGVNPLHDEIKIVDYAANETFAKLSLAELKNSDLHFNKSIKEASKARPELLEQYKKLSPKLWDLAEWLCSDSVKLGWGGRKTVGGSSWNTPSKLSPQTIVDVILNSHELE